MVKNEHIVRYTASELDAMRERGEDLTDWARIEAMTDEELEASIDFEDEGRFDWSKAQPGLPSLQRQMTVHFDADVID